MIRFLLLIVLAASVLAIITYVIHKLFRRNKFIKYLPAAALFFLGIYNLYLSRTVTSSFEDLGRAILAVLMFSGFISGLITGLLIDFVKHTR